jgi:hypothetical protein
MRAGSVMAKEAATSDSPPTATCTLASHSPPPPRAVWDNYQTSSKYQQRVKEAQAAEAAALARDRPQGHR